MKLRHLLAASFAVAPLSAVATSTTATLDAVSEAGFNMIELTFEPPLLPTGTGTTTLTGTIDVRLEIDPDTDEVSEMTILSGVVEGSPLTLAGSTPFVGSYNLTSSTLGATLATPLPPGTVDPATGDFDATQHTFTVTSGTLSGDISVPLVGIDEDISFDFATMPVGGPGSGIGSVLVTPTGATPTSKTYNVVILLPIEVVEVFEVAGPTGPLEIPISAIGTAKLVGPATIDITPLDPYVAWTAAEGIAGALFGEDENGDGVPNGLQWGLGLGAGDSPLPHLLQPLGFDGTAVEFLVNFPAGGSAAGITIVFSEDPENIPFAPLDSAAVSAGNPIPVGTQTATIRTPPITQNRVGFVRMEVADPGAP